MRGSGASPSACIGVRGLRGSRTPSLSPGPWRIQTVTTSKRWSRPPGTGAWSTTTPWSNGSDESGSGPVSRSPRSWPNSQAFRACMPRKSGTSMSSECPGCERTRQHLKIKVRPSWQGRRRSLSCIIQPADARRKGGPSTVGRKRLRSRHVSVIGQLRVRTTTAGTCQHRSQPASAGTSVASSILASPFPDPSASAVTAQSTGWSAADQGTSG
jgi:hypothetical protein